MEKKLSHPDKLLQRTYRFESIVRNKISAAYFQETKYIRVIEIWFLRKIKEYFHYQLLTTDFNFSDEDQSNTIFIKKISYLFDEVEILADEEGNIIKVENLQTLRNRWREMMLTLSLDHKGYEIENYFGGISNILENEERLIRFFHEKNMFGMFFNGQLGNYSEATSKKRNLHVNISEEFLYRKENSKIIIEIKNVSDLQEDNKSYFAYENNILNEGYVEQKENNYQIQYSLLWVG